MSGTTKRMTTVIYSIVIIIIAALLTVASVMPVMTIDDASVTYEESYYGGTLTKNLDKTGELELGFGAFINFFINLSDAQKIVDFQKGDEDLDKDEIEDYEEALEENNGLVNTVRLLYVLQEYVDDDVKEGEKDFIDKLDSGKQGIGMTYTIGSIFRILFILVIVVLTVVLPIIVIIKFIILLIKSLIGIKTDTYEDLNNRMDKFPITAFAGSMVAFYMLYTLFANGASMGIAIKAAMVIFLVSCVLRAVMAIIFAKKERLLVIVKQAITVVSIVALTLLMFNFVGLDLLNEYDAVIEEKTGIYYDTVYDDLEDQSDAEKAVYNNNLVYTLVISFVMLIGAMIIIISLVNSLERFGNKKVKFSNGEFRHHKAMIVAAAFVLVFAIVPSVFAVDSAKDREKAFEDGSFKIWYAEHLKNGTFYNKAYEMIEESIEEGEEWLEELYEELEDADDDDEIERIEKSIEQIENSLEDLEEGLKDLDMRPKRPTICLVSAIVFLLAEIAYLVVPKYIPTKKDEDEAEAVAEAETIAEAAPAADDAR